MVVVIAIIAVVIAMLLPAVQNARAAVARIGCANNLRQVTVAAHMYHDTEAAFPPSVRSGPGEAMPYLSWRGRLLPYIEQQPLWDATQAAYRTDPDPFFSVAHVGRELPLRVFGCPADARVLGVWDVNAFGFQVRTALSSYLGVSGVSSAKSDGVVYNMSRVSLSQVLDGTSQTLLYGERPPSADLFYGWWYAGAGVRQSGALDSDLGVREVNRRRRYHGCPGGPYSFSPSGPRDYCGTFHYWSYHPGGAHFAFCDGSVRFLTYSADPVMPALATRAGAEVVGDY